MKLSTTAFRRQGRHSGRIRVRRDRPGRAREAVGQSQSRFRAGADLPPARARWRCFATIPTCPRAATTSTRRAATVPASLPRVDFFHWVLVDLPPDTAADRARRVLRRRDGARQAGTARAARCASGHQRLHRLVRRRQGHGRQLLRLRRAVSAVERRDRRIATSSRCTRST